MTKPFPKWTSMRCDMMFGLIICKYCQKTKQRIEMLAYMPHQNERGGAWDGASEHACHHNLGQQRERTDAACARAQQFVSMLQHTPVASVHDDWINQAVQAAHRRSAMRM